MNRLILNIFDIFGYSILTDNEKNLPDNIIGRIDYVNKWVCFNAPTSTHAYILRHEFGHLIVYLLSRSDGGRLQGYYDKLWRYFH